MNNKRYQHILFDLDGTLTDPMIGITSSVKYALSYFNIEVEDLRSFSRNPAAPGNETVKDGIPGAEGSKLGFSGPCAEIPHRDRPSLIPD